MKTAISKPKTTISTPLSNFLKNTISARPEASGKIVLGISGGPDSVALLHLLMELGIKPTLAHVNYHLRGKDSTADQKFVEKLAKKHTLSLKILSAHPRKLSGNLEENCRDIRYSFFEKVRTASRAAAILVAHHRDDQIETFLLNLTRGASLRGFQAMPSWDPQRRLFRPLLEIPKKDLLAYLKKHHLPFRLDLTNHDTTFSRNLIRGKIIPLFQKLNPNFSKTLTSTINNLSEILQNLEAGTQIWLEENFQPTRRQEVLDVPPNIAKGGQFPLTPFLSLAPALQKNILRRLYLDTCSRPITTPTLTEILQTLRKNRAGLRKEFGPKHFLRIQKSTITDKTTKRFVKIFSIQS